MRRHLVTRLKDEKGFTMLELVVYIIIFGILTSTAVLGFANITKTNYLNNSANQVKAAMQRAMTLALNENQTVVLHFYNSSHASYPNTFMFERANGVEDKPVANSKSIYADSVDHIAFPTAPAKNQYYIKLLDGESGLNIVNDVNIVCTPEGTILTVTAGSVNVSYKGSTRTITINERGEVSL